MHAPRSVPHALRGALASDVALADGRAALRAARRLAVVIVAAVAVTAPEVPVAQPSGSTIPASEAPVAPAREPHRTDLATYIGWRVFQRHCATCHGADAEGSSFAPDLGPRIERLTRAAFLGILADGYPGPRPSELGPWAENRDVRQYADALWIYLVARASGELPPGPVEPEGGSAD